MAVQPSLISSSGSKGRNRTRSSARRIDTSLLAWAVLLLVVNLPLFWGEIRTGLLYLPDAVGKGEWWRVLTFPLVHLSWYHLLLDAGGFLLLYGCLEEKRWFPRSLYIIGAGAGSLLLASALDPAIALHGLSGLSGIAHGIMAIAALEMLRHKDQRSWGWISLFTVVGKSTYELWSGEVLFDFMHMGMCGQPLAACHAGGVVGAMVVFALMHSRPDRCHSGQEKTEVKGDRNGSQGSFLQCVGGLSAQILTRIMYRVRYRGLQRIPGKGAAVLICNHVSYVDWMIIAGACRRPVHFVMHASIYRLPLLRLIFRLAKVIPIESGKRNPATLRQAFEKISTVLQNGGLVCLFPEGRLTRNGQINKFRPGIERIIRNNPVPVVPLALRGMWGSFFSRKNTPARRSRPLRICAPIELAVGPMVPPGMATASHLRSTVQNLRGKIA